MCLRRAPMAMDDSHSSLLSKMDDATGPGNTRQVRCSSFQISQLRGRLSYTKNTKTITVGSHQLLP